MTTKIEGGLPAKPVETAVVTESASARAGSTRQSVAATPPVDSLRLTGEAVGLKTMARELGTPAKLDMARIKELRNSIDSGDYEIDPQEVAKRLLALERELLK